MSLALAFFTLSICYDLLYSRPSHCSLYFTFFFLSLSLCPFAANRIAKCTSALVYHFFFSLSLLPFTMGTGDLQLCKCLLYIYICFFSHTINSINCMSNSIDYDEQSVSSDKIVPLKSISIPPAAMKSERLVWQAPGCHRIGKLTFDLSCLSILLH